MLPKIIQGGMGVAISDWRLANTVSREGHLGVISGTGIAVVMIARLMRGDEGEHVRRALSHFPFPETAQRIVDEYYVPGGLPEGVPFKRPVMWTANPPRELNELTVAANFMEVFLAKEGHNNPVGINLLEKVQLPTMSSLYGAMLGGVDFVIMGAGVSMQIPGILDALAEHQPVSYRLDVIGTSSSDDIRVHFDPEATFPGIAKKLGPIKRPNFLPIISSFVLAQALLKRATGRIDGFVIETPIAGGHNAPPRGQVQLNDRGEPIYGEKDVIDLDKVKSLGLPFWLAGGYGNPEKFQEALDLGAAGVQIGTAFAYSDESGMDKDLKAHVIQKVLNDDIDVLTSPVASPTGFPFKVVPVEGTLTEASVYEARERVCDLGFLRHLYKTEDGKIGYRCPAEPVDQYLKKGGKEEDTVGRTCLCNNLGATAGFPNHRRSGYIEPALITSGDDLLNLKQFFRNGQTHYSAKDVIDYILQKETALP